MERVTPNTRNLENEASVGPNMGKSAEHEYSSRGGSLENGLEPSIEDGISRKLMAKLDMRILPTLTIIYVMSFLDRVNMGNALLYNLSKDLGLQGEDANTALAIFFASYVIFEIPATMLMKRIKPHVFLSLSMFFFGLCMTMQGLVQNYGGLLTTRFLMGIGEAGIYPGCYYLISMWYKREEAQSRFTFFFAGASFAGAFGGLLASAIGLMEGVGGYSAWRWIFLLEGLLTCTFSFIFFFTVSDFPEYAKWLSETEKKIILSRLANDQGDSGVQHKFQPRDMLLVVKDWRIFLSAPFYFGFVVSAYGLAYFIPSIVATYGYSGIQAQLHSVIPWCVTLVFALIIAYASDRAKVRFPFVVFCIVLSAVGNIMLLTIHNNPQAEFAAVVLYLMGIYGVIPIIVCWLSMNLRGHRERAVGIPWMVGFGNSAGIVGTFAFPPSDAPRYTLGYGLGLGFLGFSGVIAITYFIGFRVANRPRSLQERYVL